MQSLYNYRTIPEEWTCFFKERKSPDIPENISDHKRNTETTDSAFLDQEQPKKRAKTKKDTRTSYQKYLHWQKSRPGRTLLPAPEMYFRNYTILRKKC